MSERGARIVQRERVAFYGTETYDMPTGGQTGLGSHLGSMASKAQESALENMAETEAERPRGWSVRRVSVTVEIEAEALQ